MNNVSQQFVSQLITQSPVLVVYLVGLVLSVTLWGRYPRACLPAFLGTVILLGAAVAFPYLQTSIINRSQGTFGTMQFAQTMQVLIWSSSILRAVGFGLLIWAVFAGRAESSIPGSGFPVGLGPFSPPFPGPGRHPGA